MIFVKYSIFKVKNPHASTDGTLKDFCDGEDYKNHPLFGENHSALVLHGYFDEFEVANALGSKAKKHKLGKIKTTSVNISGGTSLTCI